MPVKIYQVDAFADKPFSGNPAAVCIMENEADSLWMQKVAMEMNLSETAFLHEEGDGYNLRWFTPTTEIDLCGHATLASAHILWEEGFLDPKEDVQFKTRSGILGASKKSEIIELDFPSAVAQEVPVPEGLLESLNVEPLYVGKNKFDYLVQVDSEAIIRTLEPDLNLLKSLPARGVIITSICKDPAYDLISRFFGPAAGIDEDPVTGSAHCCLGPFWGKRLGKSRLVGFQASERGGTVHVTLKGDRVILGGRAVTVLKGELYQ